MKNTVRKEMFLLGTPTDAKPVNLYSEIIAGKAHLE